MRAAALLALLAAPTAAQVEWPHEGHEPRRVAAPAAATTRLPDMDLEERRGWAAREDAKGRKVFWFAEMNNVSVGLRDFAAAPAPRGTVYTHTFAMSNALSVAVYFRDFHIPEGGALWAYGTGARVRGPFTYMNVHPANNGAYSIAHIPGPSVTLEYFSPAGADPPRLDVAQVATAYRADGDPDPRKPPAGNHSRRAGRCNIHAACADGGVTRCSGALWNDASSSVQCVYEDGVTTLGRWADGAYWDDVSRCEVRLTMGGGRCSGSVIHTEFGPRFLTAEHCVCFGNPGTFYVEFNFKNPSCESYDDNAGNPDDVVTGMASVTGGMHKGDIHMFELNSAIPRSYNAYSCGYDYSRGAVPQAIAVHHPGASNMKVSNARNGAAPSTECYPSDPQDTCYRVDQWTAGTTEGGSSGSPLINANTQRVVGTLCCGTAMCPAGNGYDEYGAAYSFADPTTIFGRSETGDGAEIGAYPGTNVTWKAVRPRRDA